jgi:aminoglycoside phosphotransferase (APT) family kinase protein
MHPGQLSIREHTVRALVHQQFPQWRDLPVRAVPSQGTVNALFRLGSSLVARFPLVPGEVGDVRRMLESEAQAARELLARTRFPTPEPIALGEPGAGYPLPWSVQTWLPGTVASAADPSRSVAFAHDLAEFILGVRAIDTRGRTFRGSDRRGRGGHLPDHDAWVQTCLANSRELLDVGPLRRLWSELRDLPPPGSDLMTHGDLIPGNVLVADGRLAGVIDVGGLGPADPALDLVAAWHLLDSGPRRALKDDLRSSDVEWARGAAWALEQALGLVWYYADSNPGMSATGRRTLERLATWAQLADL